MKRRMGDNEEIPEMNGTIKRLVDLVSSPLETPEQQAIAIRESVKLQLHTYVIQKQLLEAVNNLLNERQSIINRLVDRGLVPFLYFIAMAIFWLVFTSFKP